MALQKQSKTKVMDVAHPKLTQPSMTSRPLLVSNRPMIAEDPMIAQAAEAAAHFEQEKHDEEVPQKNTPEPTTAPLIQHRSGKPIRPLTIDDRSDSDAVVVKKEDKANAKPAQPKEESKPVAPRVVIRPLSEQETTAPEATPETEPEEAVAPEETPEATIILEEDTAESEVVKNDEKVADPDEANKKPVDAVPVSHQTSGKTEKAAAVSPKADTEPPRATLQETEVSSGEDETNDLPTEPDEDDPKEETPEQKEVANLENLIATKKYFVNVGQSRGRRRALLFGVLLIILLGIVMVDVLLDMGVLSISGVPHTSFFDVRE